MRAAILAGVLAGCGGGDAPVPADQPSKQPQAQEAAKRGVKLVRVGSFDQPLYVTSPQGDQRSIYVVEQGGKIWRVENGRKRPFADLSAETKADGERGLLGLTFAKDFAQSGIYYVYFTDTSNGDVVIQQRGGGAAKELLRIEHREFANHNGGQLTLGPDGKLYAGVGDGGSGGDPNNHAEDKGSRLGKILRFDPANPSATEVYAYGLRNPYRFSWDRASKSKILIGDVGQDEVEEVDVSTRAGQNFGWSIFEGTRRFKRGSAPGAVKPIVQRLHKRDGVCSVTGGYVVRDRSLPGLYGRYVYGDFCESTIRSVKISGARGGGDRAERLKVSSLSSFGEDGRGRVYATSLSGSVYRLAAR